jgi:hypothetical protein
LFNELLPPLIYKSIFHQRAIETVKVFNVAILFS